MAAKIKLQRQGTRNKPFYRVVIQDESAPRNGKVVAILGQYNPLKEPSEFVINKDKVLDWLGKGVQPTDKVRILLGKAGILPAVNLAALPKKKARAEALAETKVEEKPKEKS
ncbi:30S ribosomal protein S16 [Candidatus Saganbacteria bacterium]|nr:30S ribosomal protein S16 [Candidatus Saganbacteria bacterium]